MSVVSLGAAKLKDLLKQVTQLNLSLDAAITFDPKDFFACARSAREMSLYGVEVTNELARQWDSLDTGQRLFAVMVAREAPSPAMTPHLTNSALTARNLYPRLDAIAALGEAEPDVVAPTLQQLVEDSNEEVRQRALQALRGIDCVPEVETLRRRLDDSSPGVRNEAVRALAGIPGDHAALALLDALDDPQMGVALQAQKLLFARRDERDLVLDMIARLQEFGQRGRYRQTYAVELLARLKDARCIEPLTEHLVVCRNNDVKIAIATALGRFKDPSVLPGLWQLVQDEHEKVQAHTLKVLKRHPTEESLPALQAVVERIARIGRCAVGFETPLTDAIAAIPGEASTELLVDCAVSPVFGMVKAAVAALEKRGAQVAPARLEPRLAAKAVFRDEIAALYATISAGDLTLGSTDEAGSDAGARAGTVSSERAAPDPRDEEQDTAAAIERMSQTELVSYLESQTTIDGLHHSVFPRLLDIDTPAAHLQLRRYLKSRQLHERAQAATTLRDRGHPIDRHDEVAILIHQPRRTHESLDAYPTELGDVLEEGIVAQMDCSDRMIRIIWDAGHPYRVPFALRWLGVTMNGEKYGKVAFDCLKTDREAAEPAALEALLDPPAYPRSKVDPGQLALLLGRFRTKAAVGKLMDGLVNGDLKIAERKCYAEALGQIGDARAVPALLDVLPDAPEGPLLRKILESLGRLKATDAVAAIEAREIRDPKLEPVRQKVLERLRG